MLDLTDPRQVLAGTAWGEARGEGGRAMQGVINVVMNRLALNGWMGHNIVEVCLKPYQFSCWLADDPNRAKILNVAANDPQFVEALALADLAMHDELSDIVAGATSYYDTSIQPPAWARGQPPLAIIGNLIFLKAK